MTQKTDGKKQKMSFSHTRRFKVIKKQAQGAADAESWALTVISKKKTYIGTNLVQNRIEQQNTKELKR